MATAPDLPSPITPDEPPDHLPVEPDRGPAESPIPSLDPERPFVPERLSAFGQPALSGPHAAVLR